MRTTRDFDNTVLPEGDESWFSLYQSLAQFEWYKPSAEDVTFDISRRRLRNLALNHRTFVIAQLSKPLPYNGFFFEIFVEECTQEASYGHGIGVATRHAFSNHGWHTANNGTGWYSCSTSYSRDQELPELKSPQWKTGDTVAIYINIKAPPAPSSTPTPTPTPPAPSSTPTPTPTSTPFTSLIPTTPTTDTTRLPVVLGYTMRWFLNGVEVMKEYTVAEQSATEYSRHDARDTLHALQPLHTTLTTNAGDIYVLRRAGRRIPADYKCYTDPTNPSIGHSEPTAPPVIAPRQPAVITLASASTGQPPAAAAAPQPSSSKKKRTLGGFLGRKTRK
eukprot:TRINITY_DN4184_c0_g1_i1.p1 TRINITY_DN4184_c0_g1~~TRINITY_DN4184_c0_g1_i1.p1  ORF type:complete len:333 (+),score=56.60 TRINITY_DN4184_c0_g1_i1:360-1358(+)